jgi:glycosyltransferase involved in cell wall biosynthesis
MRIEMVLPTLARAGMETVTAELGRGLAARGHDVGFTCLEEIGELGRELAADGLRVSLVSAPGLRPNVLPRELKAWFSTLRPDVVHAHSGTWLKAAQGARGAGVPMVVLTLHGVATVQPWYLRPYGLLSALRADHVVAVTVSLRSHLVERLGVPASRVSVVHNGISTTRFCHRPRSRERRAALGIPHDATVVGNVARLHPVKNHELLLDAFALLLSTNPRAFLLLVGDGPLRQALQERARTLAIADRLRITGVVADTAGWFNEMDVFALSSHTEGMSISLLEAMACEVPVVATAVGGTPALLENGSLGTLTPPGDPQAMADAMRRVLADRAGSGAVAIAARATVERSYSTESMVEAYEKVYQRCGARNAAARRVETV